MRESAACLSMQADIGTFLAFRLDPPLPRNSTFFFFLSFAQPPAVYNRVCKSSHSGRVKQSSRNRGLLSRSADFLHSIGGNRFGYLDPTNRRDHPIRHIGLEYSLTRGSFPANRPTLDNVFYIARSSYTSLLHGSIPYKR